MSEVLRAVAGGWGLCVCGVPARAGAAAVSMVTVGKNGRVYPRAFDHDQAREFYAEGASLAELAAVYGVVPQAIKRVVDPVTYERMSTRTREFFKTVCEDCGGPCSKNWYNSRPTLRMDRVVCVRCAGVRRSEEALLARLDEDGNLRCSVCGRWKPMAEYASRRTSQGMVVPRHDCRECSSAARRRHRHANAEATRAWDREYRKRRRAAAST